MAGARRAVYDVRMILHHADGTLTIDSQQIFYAAPFAAAKADGSVEVRWRLIGQHDLSN